MRVSCKLCGEVYYIRDGHKCKPAPKRPAKPQSKPKPNPANTTSADVKRVNEWRQKNADRYKSYQRTLMRKLRAKKSQ